MSEHSRFSASNFEAGRLCPGRHVMQQGLPDSASKYAREGTAAHEVLEWCITNALPPEDRLGHTIIVDGNEYEVDDEMVEAVQITLDNIRALAGEGAQLLSERRVRYGAALEVDDNEAFGTLDVTTITADAELQVHDFKYGRGVIVSAEENEQMMLYALGMLAVFEPLLGEVRSVRLVIHQPRAQDEPSQWMTTPDALRVWAREVAAPSVRYQKGAEQMRGKLTDDEWRAIYLKPNASSCKFCRARGVCPALRDDVSMTTFGSAPATPEEFADATLMPVTNALPDAVYDAAGVPIPETITDAWLGSVLKRVDTIEEWCGAVRAEAERRMLAGRNVPGWKLVEGRQGNRAWVDKDAAEAALKTMRLRVDQMYALKLISPTAAEKLAKGKDAAIGERQWKKLQKLVTRAPGKPHVAPLTDPRPVLALTSAADDFPLVSATPAGDFADIA